MDFNRGQGATEYMIILGVILVVALLVISVLAFFPGTVGDTGITESQIYWNSARIFSVKDVYADSALGCSGTPDGGYRLTLHNTALETVVLTNVTLEGEKRNFCLPGETSPATSIIFGISEKQAIIVDFNSTVSDCSEPGQFISKDLRFEYDQGDSIGLVQQGAKRLMFRCSS